MLAATSVKFEGKRAMLLEVRLLRVGEYWPETPQQIAITGFWGTLRKNPKHIEHIGPTWSCLMRWVKQQHDVGADVTIYSDRSNR